MDGRRHPGMGEAQNPAYRPTRHLYQRAPSRWPVSTPAVEGKLTDEAAVRCGEQERARTHLAGLVLVYRRDGVRGWNLNARVRYLR